MSKRLILLACIVTIPGIASAPAVAGLAYSDPAGDWDYMFEGDGDAYVADGPGSLDGTWDHDIGSSDWDGSAPGEVSGPPGDAPGGAGVFTEGPYTFLRFQDAGHTRDFNPGWSDPSNRRMAFAHDMGQETGVNGATILDDGVTLSFRIRIPTTGTLDPIYPDGASSTSPWPAGGIGYVIHSDGLGPIGIKQGTGNDGVISFGLTTGTNDGGQSTTSGPGLVMNQKSKTDLGPSDNDPQTGNSGGDERLLPIADVTEWHEFWVQIVQENPATPGTHTVKIWMDGNTGAPDGEFVVSSGVKNLEDSYNGHLLMCMSSSDDSGSQDYDFFGYKAGLHAPLAAQFDPEQARDPYPTNKATGVNPVCPEKVVLHWTPGDSAPLTGGHHVYFSEVFDDVNQGGEDANQGIQDSNEFPESPAAGLDLEYGTTYYWKINEYNVPDNEWIEGNVWKFTTEAHQIPNASITVTAENSEGVQIPENTLDLPEDEELHSTSDSDMWLSALETPQPSIKYEFDRVYKLREMWVWNYNGSVSMLLGLGARNVTIETSLDDVLYTPVGGGAYEFAKATGKPDYAHDDYSNSPSGNNEIDLGGVAAKYVRITVNSNWGGIMYDQTGLSEVRFFYIPMRAAEPVSPEDEKEKVARNVTLQWQKPLTADITTHKVYISTDEQAVIDRTVDPYSVLALEGLCDKTAGYSPPSLEYDTLYYWTVDEYYDSETHNTWESDQVWSFTVTIDPNDLVDPNMLIWLKLDGNVNDSSGYRNHGTENGNLGYTDGYVGPGMDPGGQAMEFISADEDHVDLPLGLIGTDIGSASFWIKTTEDEDDEYGHIFYGAAETGGNGGGSENEFHIDVQVSGIVRLFIEGGDPDIELEGPVVNDDKWHHIAATWDITGNVILYVDGSPLSAAHTGNNFIFSARFRLGQPGDNERWYDGLLDDVRVFDYALSEAEILKIIRGDPASAWNPKPQNSETGVARNAVLSWTPGDYAPTTQGHYVYFGADDPDNLALVASQPQSPNSYNPGTLDLGTTYYWAVDEANTAVPGGVDAGNIWTFTTIDHLVVDDMESYGDGKTPSQPGNCIFFVWRDGWTLNETDGFPAGFLSNNTGASIGNWDPPFAETTIVSGGRQSMPYLYDNDGEVHGGNNPANTPNPNNPLEYYSKAKAEISDLQPLTQIGPDWTAGGAKALSLQFYGSTTNAIESMWVELTDGAGGKATVTYGTYDGENPTDINDPSWRQWNIDLQDFDDGGVNLANVSSMAIGFGNPIATTPGGSGTVFFDDIRLYAPRCVLGRRDADFALVDYAPEGDPGGDCVVNYKELEVMTRDWLQTDYIEPAQLLVHWAFDDAAGPTASDSSNNSHAGDISGATWVNDLERGWCLDFSDGDFVLDNDADAYLNGLHGLTVSIWVKSREIDSDRGFIIFHNPSGNDTRDIRYDSAGSSGGGTSVIKCGVNTTDGSQQYESASAAQTTLWQHVALTWSTGNDLKLYIDGNLDEPTYIQAIRAGTLTGYDLLMVGKGGKDELPADSWNGLIDDVRIFNYPLSAAEIATVKAGGTLPAKDVYYPLASPAELYDAELAGSRSINFKDYAVLMDRWLDEGLFPPPSGR